MSQALGGTGYREQIAHRMATPKKPSGQPSQQQHEGQIQREDRLTRQGLARGHRQQKLRQPQRREEHHQQAEQSRHHAPRWRPVTSVEPAARRRSRGSSSFNAAARNIDEVFTIR